MKQKKLIFSKQCDHDADLFPFWLHWYQNVFQADEIIITPVKTQLSETKKTIAFYESAGLKVYPIEIESWSDSFVWSEQLRLLSPHANNYENFIAISADVDQFFQNPNRLSNDTEVVFLRVHLISNQCPSLKNLRSCSISAHVSDDHTAGFVDSLDNKNIFLTGHYIGEPQSIPKENLLLEWHLSTRGFEQFKAKVQSLSVEDDGTPHAGHWKRWREKLENEGEDSLRFSFNERNDLTSLGTENKHLLEQFISLAEGNSAALPTENKLDSPFPSRLMGIPIEWKSTDSTTRKEMFHFPEGEYQDVRRVISGELYSFPHPKEAPVSVIDIGANLGAFSFKVLTQYSDAEVYCFEPSMTNVKLLTSNLRPFKKASIFPYGLANRNRLASLYLSKDKSSRHSTSAEPKGQDVEIVQLRKATDALDELGKTAFNALKISVNGAELEIFQNLGDHLKSFDYVLLHYFSEENRRSIDQMMLDFELFALHVFNSGEGLAKYKNKVIK